MLDRRYAPAAGALGNEDPRALADKQLHVRNGLVIVPIGLCLKNKCQQSFEPGGQLGDI